MEEAAGSHIAVEVLVDIVRESTMMCSLAQMTEVREIVRLVLMRHRSLLG